MNMLEAVANWYGCPYNEGKDCRKNCDNYLLVDPRTASDKGLGHGDKGHRTLCTILDDLNGQIMKKTNDSRLAAD